MNFNKIRNYIVVGLIALIFSMIIFAVYTSDYNFALTNPQKMLWVFLFAWNLYAIFLICASENKDEIKNAIKIVPIVFGLAILVNIFYTIYFYASSIFIKHLLEIGGIVTFFVLIITSLLSFSIIDDGQGTWL